tara:strand:- start:355 stop:534 length:180 start_codon:yes stop_codon:yes gene_type:complete
MSDPLYWVRALESQRKAKLESLKDEVKRREHYVKTGEWVYDLEEDRKKGVNYQLPITEW